MNGLVRYTVLVGLLIFSVKTGSAQINRIYQEPKKYVLDSPYRGLPTRFPSYQYYTATNLMSNTIMDLTEDKDGRIWFVLNNYGFGCIDGEHAYHYGSNNGFLDRMSDIHCDKEGRIWVGGNGTGTYCLSGEYYFTLYARAAIYGDHFDKHDVSDAHIQDYKHDSENNVYIATRLGGVSCIKKDTSIWWTEDNSELDGSYILDLTIDGKDRVWFRNRNKTLHYIEDDKLYRFDSTIFDYNNIRAIGFDGHDYIVGVTFDGKYYRITPESVEEIPIKFPDGKQHSCTKIESDREGNLTLGDSHHVFQIIGTQAIDLIGMPEIHVRRFIFDQNNGLWVATTHNGIIHIPRFNISRYFDRPIWTSNDDLKIFRAGDYLLKGKHLSGINFEFDTIATYFKPTRNRRIAHLTSGISFEADGKNYFLKKNGELDPELAKKYSDLTYLSRYKDATVLMDRNNKKYSFETSAGNIEKTDYIHERGHVKIIDKESDRLYLISLVKDGVFHYCSYENGKIDTIIPFICKDTMRLTGGMRVDDTTLIVTTWGHFFGKITPNTQEWFGSESAGSNILSGSIIDSRGNLWAAGIENGVNYLDAKTHAIINLYDENGLVGSRVRGYAVSQDGSMVVSTNKGVTHFKLVKNIAVKNREDFFEKYKIKTYTNSEGLSGEGFYNTVVDEKDGSIWLQNSENETQIILPTKLEKTKPKNLRFETIQIENKNHELKTIFRWIPGREYRSIDRIEMDYKERLILTMRSIYFDNHHKQSYSFKIDEGNWADLQRSPEFRLAGLESGEHMIFFKAISEKGVDSEPITLTVFIKGPFYEKAWFWILCSAGLFTIVWFIFRWRTHIVRERAKQLEQTVKERTEEIEIQKIEIETQHGEIKDSIEYAKRIQEAILPAESRIKKLLPDSFILYKPKDIVAGDFYWLEETSDHLIFAAADCTGHGVPGAMVSVVCHNALNRSVREFKASHANDILNKTRELVIETFEQSDAGVKDGMDIAVCSIHKKTLKMTFSGANNPLYLIRKGDLREQKGDKQPIGVYDEVKPFSNHEFQLEKGDVLYTFTDGFADQFGGEKGKKFKYKPFKELLFNIRSKPMDEQLKILHNTFEEWKGELEQVDDVCVIGVRI